MTSHKCPHCAPGMMEEQAYKKVVKKGRQAVHVDGLLKFVCASCSGEAVTRLQFKLNRERVAEAIRIASERVVTPSFLRDLREQYQLSQRAASQLFGAGESSFGKWEAEQIAISTPTSLLLRCAADVSGVMDYLAELSGVTLEAPVAEPSEVACEAGDEVFMEVNSCVVLEFANKRSIDIPVDEKSPYYNPTEYRGSRSNRMGILK